MSVSVSVCVMMHLARALCSLKPAYRPRGVCAGLRVRSVAAPPRTGSSPGRAAVAAAGCPGSCDHHHLHRGGGAAPSRGCSAAAAGSSLHLLLLRWRSSSCSQRYRPRYHHCHCCQRCRSCRNDRSQTETETESSGGPWLGRAVVVDGRDGGPGSLPLLRV